VKRLAVFALVAGTLLLLAAGGAWTTWDCSFHCAKCLAHEHVTEEQILGLAVVRRTTFEPAPPDYERLFGRPCAHEFRRVGIGRETHAYHGTIKCGMAAEGLFIQPRLYAVAATFDAERRIGDAALAIQTLAFIDTLIAPDEGIEMLNDHTVRPRAIALHELAYRVGRATSVEEWRAALRSGRAWRSRSH
jgi:hypothetical protein